MRTSSTSTYRPRTHPRPPLYIDPDSVQAERLLQVAVANDHAKDTIEKIKQELEKSEFCPTAEDFLNSGRTSKLRETVIHNTATRLYYERKNRGDYQYELSDLEEAKR
jgi:hypothetical protein